jgi:4-hydroxybenzoate polyprenyltransferase
MLLHRIIVALAGVALFSECTMLFSGSTFDLIIFPVFSSIFIAYSNLPKALLNVLSGIGLKGLVSHSSLLAGGIAVFSTFIFAFLVGGLETLWMFISCAFLYFLYLGAPIQSIPGIRTVPFLKPVIVSLTWSILVATVAAQTSGVSLPDKQHLLVFSGVFLFVFSLAILCDLADKEVDASTSLQTMAMSLGARFTISLALLFSLAQILLTEFLEVSQNIRISSLVSFLFVMLAISFVRFLPPSTSRRAVDFCLLLKPMTTILLFA